MYLTGYTPFPETLKDSRLPHLAQKISRQIRKTALGAENSIPWQHDDDIEAVLTKLKQQGFTIAVVEQTPNALKLSTYNPPGKIALIVGREVEGVEPEVLAAADVVLEIPMFGAKESFNVVQAAAMALYHCRFALL